MDLIDLIAEKKFLGQDFLTWLWYKSDERGGPVNIPGSGDVLIVFEKHLLLEYGEGDAHEKVICQGLQAELKEARTGLAMGKKLEQARIHLVQGDYEWHLTLKGSLMEFRSVKPPKTMEQTEESDDPSAIEAKILDRIGMIETAVRTIDDLLRMFLEQKTSPDWDNELQKIRRWVKKGASTPSTERI